MEIDIGAGDGSGSHCVSATCMGANTGGDTYSINGASDTQQGTPGGQREEPMTYDKSSNTITAGPKWAVGKKILYFMVECLN